MNSPGHRYDKGAVEATYFWGSELPGRANYDGGVHDGDEMTASFA